MEQQVEVLEYKPQWFSLSIRHLHHIVITGYLQMTHIQNGSTTVSQNDTTSISFWCSECEFVSFLLLLLQPPVFLCGHTDSSLHSSRLVFSKFLSAKGTVPQVHPTFSFICSFTFPMFSSTNENYLSDIMFSDFQLRFTSSTTAQPGSKSVLFVGSNISHLHKKH